MKIKPNNCVILFIGLTFTFLSILYLGLSSDYSFSVTSEIPKTITTSEKSTELVPGYIYSKRINPTQNNLGIIVVSFDPSNKPILDLVKFRIKEVGEDWFYESIYDGRQFHYLNEYPFGFPPISDSSQKEFVFELSSVNNIDNNIIVISSEYPIVTLKYHNEVRSIQSLDGFYSFLQLKFNYALYNSDFIFRSLLTLNIYLILSVFIIFKDTKHFRFIKKALLSNTFIRKIHRSKYSSLAKVALIFFSFDLIVMSTHNKFLSLLIFLLLSYLAYKDTFFIRIYKYIVLHLLLLLQFSYFFNLLKFESKIFIWIYYFFDNHCDFEYNYFIERIS